MGRYICDVVCREMEGTAQQIRWRCRSRSLSGCRRLSRAPVLQQRNARQL